MLLKVTTLPTPLDKCKCKCPLLTWQFIASLAYVISVRFGSTGGSVEYAKLNPVNACHGITYSDGQSV